jgi:putative CocE/NonD family hydrolase
MTHRLIVELEVDMETRDGVVLRADVYRPDSKAKVPAILCRTPYDKTQRPHLEYLPPRIAAANGFGFVFQDIRGRFASDGEWAAAASELEVPDGYDTIEWVAAEPWCTGSVGMVGASYESFNQFMAMMAGPPSLKAIAPQSSGYTPRGIVLLDALVSWGSKTAKDWLARHPVADGAEQRHYEALLDLALRDPVAAAQHLPLSENPLTTIPIPNNPFHIFLDAAESGLLGFVPPEAFTVPSLWTSGYYDLSLGAVKQFCAIRERGGTEAAREGTRLIIGPWHHEHVEPNIGEAFFGIDTIASESGVQDAHLRFFSRHLRDNDSSPDLPVVRYFVMGDNTWHDGDAWPPSPVEVRSMFLRSTGAANSAAGDGRLSWELPASEPADTYRYDPATPVPAYGGRFFWGDGGRPFGPLDQARIERRDDVLVYTSDVLDAPLTIAGNVDVELFISSSAPDTDFVVKLCEVHTDGVSLNLADGICRTRWRSDGDTVDPPLAPGETYAITVELGPVGHEFRPGHRVRLQVTSSCFPWYDRNMNTGNALGIDAVGVVATQIVHHEASFASRVLLPVRD